MFYFIKLHTKILDMFKNGFIARNKCLDDFLEKGQSIHAENYDFIDFNINNNLQEILYFS